MCFSATASFTASAALAVIGVGIVSRLKNKQLLPLALCPLFFALQQAAEGFVWLDLPNTSFAKDLYLFFAYSFWSVWGPFCMWFIEKNPLKRTWIVFFGGMGISNSLVFATYILESTAIEFQASIQYIHVSNVSELTAIVLALTYVIAGVTPFLISSLRGAKVIGIFSLGGAIVVTILYKLLFASLWCFFMALISFLLVWFIPKAEKQLSRS